MDHDITCTCVKSKSHKIEKSLPSLCSFTRDGGALNASVMWDMGEQRHWVGHWHWQGVMTGLLRLRSVTRRLLVSLKEGRRDRFLLGGVVHGGSVLLNLPQVLGVLGGLVEVRVRDLLVSMKQLLAFIISSTKLTGDLLQVMVSVTVIVQFVMCLKHLRSES